MIDAIEVVPCPKLPEVKIVLQTQFEDARGRICIHYTSETESKILSGKRFNHNKVAVSYRNVIRGIHGDNKSYKLVSCLNGEVYQVVVDCRKNVTSFG